jgi:protein O-GlcNAc transferase
MNQAAPNASFEAFKKAYQAYQAGQGAAALGFCNEAVRIFPKNAEALHLAGVILASSGDFRGAVPLFEKVVSLKPTDAEVLVNLANAYQALGRVDMALKAYAHAVNLNPSQGAVFYQFGLALKKSGRAKEALVAFKKAHELLPKHAQTLAEICTLIYHQGTVEEARSYYQKMLALQKVPGLYVTSRLLIPPIIPSREAIPTIREEYEGSIDALMREDIRIENPYQELLRSSFYLAYQGVNNKALMQKLASLYLKLCPILQFTAPHCLKDNVGAKKPIRIGFVSKYFHSHSVSSCYNEMIIALAAEPDFEVTILSTDKTPKEDDTFKKIKAACKSYVPLSHDIKQAQQQVAELMLDVLVFTEIGMDGLAYYLSFARLAPAQVMLGGHPDTSGIQTVDYMISSTLLEPENAQEHYSEKLVLMDFIPGLIPPPVRPSVTFSRKELGLPEKANLYVCPMKLQKIHPDFDFMMRDILAADPECYIILFKDNLADWHELLLERLQRAIPEREYLSRIIFLPFIAPERFPHYLLAADAILDTPHFGGGTTSYMALGMDIPIVTLPGEFSRARATLSCYSMMQMNELVANDTAEYVRLVVKLGKDIDFNAKMRQKISQNKAKIFAEGSKAEAMAACFHQLAVGAK